MSGLAHTESARQQSRTHQRQLTGLLFLAIAFLMMASGCPNDVPDDGRDGRSMEGAVVPLMLPLELGLADDWQIPITEWEADSGATIELLEYDTETIRGNTSELGRGGSLVICPLSLVPQLHSDAELAPLTDEAAGSWQTVFDALRKSVGSPGGNPMVFPLSAPPLLCFYRADLLDQAGLTPPKTWAEYRQLLATVEEWAPGLSVVEPWGEQYRATMFLQRSVGYAVHPDNFSFTLDVSSGDPLINQPPFVRALDEINTDLVHLDPESLSMGPVECYLQIARGNAALAIGMLPDHEETASRDEVGGESSNQVRVQQLPGAAEVFHTQQNTWLDLGAGSPNSLTIVGLNAWVACVVEAEDKEIGEHAWELWSAIDNPENQGSRASSAFQRGSRMSDFAERPEYQRSGLDAEQRTQYISAVSSSLGNSRVFAELPFPGHDRYRQLMTQRLTEVLVEQRDPEATLNDLSDDWRQLSEEVGASTVLNTYRWSLGLSPLLID